MNETVSRILLGLLGAVIALVCGYGIYYIFVELIVKGILTQSWIALIGGAILAYLFLGLLIVGVIIGLLITVNAIME